MHTWRVLGLRVFRLASGRCSSIRAPLCVCARVCCVSVACCICIYEHKYVVHAPGEDWVCERFVHQVIDEIASGLDSEYHSLGLTLTVVCCLLCVC